MKIDLPDRSNEVPDNASSPGLPANGANHYAATVGAMLAARADRRPSPRMAVNATNDFAESLRAQLAARAERLRTASFSTPHPSRSNAGIWSIDPDASRSVRPGHIWVRSLLGMLFAGVAVLAVWGLPFGLSKPPPPSRVELSKPPLPSSRIEPAKVAAIPVPAPVEEQAPLPVSPPPVLQEVANPPPALAPEPKASPAAVVLPVTPAPLNLQETRELQRMLEAAGFNPGPIDGVVGPMTLSAVRKYAEARTIPNAGPTRDLMSRLKTEPPLKK